MPMLLKLCLMKLHGGCWIYLPFSGRWQNVSREHWEPVKRFLHLRYVYAIDLDGLAWSDLPSLVREVQNRSKWY
jgi:hypothetical protein